jgi:FtsP/CotA-like multicopper oxidase with cupredoxin domain
LKISRRSFLKATLGAGTALCLSPFPIHGSYAETKRKVREFRFSASKSRVNLGVGPDFWAWTYNDQVPGPEIRVKEGEVIRVVLKNYLPEETSIHWHGVPVPNGMDGVPGLTQEGVKPGETFVYEFTARPSGTYIYHSHARYQLDQGLYGPLIIEPARETRSYDREHTLLLEDWVMKDNGGVANTPRRPAMGMMRGMMGRRSMRPGEPLLEPLYDAYAVNGRVYPAMEPLRVKRGDRVKLRIANPSSATIYDLCLAGHSLTVTHADGRPLQPLVTDILRIGMGERYDVEFTADHPGYWLLSAMERGFGERNLRIPVKYEGTSAHEPISPDFGPSLRFATYWNMQSLYPLSSSDLERPTPFISQTLSGGMHSPYWTINGQVYPDVEPIRLPLDEHVRIDYVNRSMMPHPMHLHGHFFKIVNPRLPTHRWIQKDTLLVYPMERVEIELIADNPGRWFHHCHNLYHMMAGMANVLTVEEK